MPRQSREFSPTYIYHVMIRGNERKNLFLDDEDRTKFLEILDEKKQLSKYSLYTYCLMDNHVHLLIKEEVEELSQIMKRINVAYAYYFNNKYQRIGHVFQDRYRSEAIHNEQYLLAVVSYIHNNPVKAGIVEYPAYYRWSSYCSYIDMTLPIARLIEREIILGLFSRNSKNAIRLFIDYSKQESSERFTEIGEEINESKPIIREAEATSYINVFLAERKVTLGELKRRDHRETRDQIIRHLKKNSTLSIRRIADLLRIDRNIIQRVK